ncbi:CLUMA_CG005895, isoform A [Clunio marinus]|uniref:CLUMA_CG005895, isoform A n=1 Tax=Clunio marinus TaxID=568069 RepID=A0A1J1HWG6_9DIPT|nr:CLUMA_CG005895, isoform A [Clunio marinus]
MKVKWNIEEALMTALKSIEAFVNNHSHLVSINNNNQSDYSICHLLSFISMMLEMDYHSSSSTKESEIFSAMSLENLKTSF